ncbi:MAG: 3-hydroxyacyl-CoA dehydrogenase [Comamonas sp. SCN 65-56]|uniref:3-hydroxyacyl-CoA dehydrogenase n=1 Tax=Comamonas sp. SCN 65-56 TaxID=1660095 RepID=UPI00086966CA|nr:3-hydroxyacyl-CoA dehydrogenase [Comamonas sp. SCN 65-56]ODS91463.1 MAG: 3-hydroxyacyl-CoA dehydrogenase [Comamonas sp. SCN 65-56]
MTTSKQDILLIGVGVMGQGIAQVAAQAGHRVFLFDTFEGAAVKAREKIATTFTKLVEKAKLTQQDADATLARLLPIQTLAEGKTALLAIEAVVERLDVKHSLFQQLEDLLPEGAILATNTSSISVTAIGAGLKRPERLVGMHFFNPAPLMKLVEVVHGLRTDKAIAAEVEQLARAWGKTPVHARSTPGFIVNRIARPYYAEALMLLQEQALAPEALDAVLRAAGFRMGPCELMDLIGLDTNYAVTKTVFEANFYDRRFTPSLVQRELVEAGQFGRKNGRGFYVYPEGAPALAPCPVAPPAAGSTVVVHGSGTVADALAVAAKGFTVSRVPTSNWVGLQLGSLQLRQTDGRSAWQIARAEGLAQLAVFDELPTVAGGAIAFATTGAASAAHAAGVLQALGWQPVPMQDAPGLVVARTLAMLVNEAADAVQQGVCTPDGADAAMKLGVNYPAGPFEWLQRLGRSRVIGLIEALDACYRGERYRISPWLQRAGAA